MTPNPEKYRDVNAMHRGEPGRKPGENLDDFMEAPNYVDGKGNEYADGDNFLAQSKEIVTSPAQEEQLDGEMREHNQAAGSGLRGNKPKGGYRNAP